MFNNEEIALRQTRFVTFKTDLFKLSHSKSLEDDLNRGKIWYSLAKDLPESDLNPKDALGEARTLNLKGERIMLINLAVYIGPPTPPRIFLFD